MAGGIMVVFQGQIIRLQTELAQECFLSYVNFTTQSLHVYHKIKK